MGATYLGSEIDQQGLYEGKDHVRSCGSLDQLLPAFLSCCLSLQNAAQDAQVEDQSEQVGLGTSGELYLELYSCLLCYYDTMATKLHPIFVTSFPGFTGGLVLRPLKAMCGARKTNVSGQERSSTLGGILLTHAVQKRKYKNN